MTTPLERLTAEMLVWHHARFICPLCHNSGGEGKHVEGCKWKAMIDGWRKAND